jgi:hypothetical protein
VLPSLIGDFTSVLQPTGSIAGIYPALSGAVNGLVDVRALRGVLPALTGRFSGAVHMLGLIASSDMSDLLTLETTLVGRTVVNCADTNIQSVVASATFTETSNHTDAFRFVLNNLLTANLNLTTSLTEAVAAVLTSTEILAHTDALEARANVSTNLLETLVAAEVFRQVADLTETETVALAATLSEAIQAELASTETAVLTDALQHSVVFLLNASAALTDSAGLTFSTLLDLSDGAAFIARLPLEDGDYQAWVMNAETTGTTQYVNYPMNSLFTFKGVPYGVSETGLYLLEGETDDGDPINSIVATGDMNFGTSREKNIPRCYLYLTQTGQVVLKTISNRQGSRHETYYELAERTTDSTDDDTYRRVPLGRGVRGVWWRFELHALNGATINLDGAEIRPVVLSRRG